jgi:hypothetical protein
MLPRHNEIFHVRETGELYIFSLTSAGPITHYLDWIIKNDDKILQQYRLTFRTWHNATLTKDALKTAFNIRHIIGDQP